MSVLVANNISTTLASGVGPSDGTITVASSTGMPTPGASQWFYATIQSVDGASIEVVKCTSRSGATLTVTRAQDGTTAQSFSAGAFVELRVNAQVLRDFDWSTVRGVANGLAGLDAGAKVPVAQLPTNTASGVAGLDGASRIAEAQLPTTALLTTVASATYQTIAGMSSYLTTALAASTYQTIAGMSSYLTTASAASTYLTQASAASTYLSQASAASTYLPKTGGAVGPITINSGKLLSKITVSSSAPGSLADGELYLKY